MSERINIRQLASELARREGLTRGMGVAEWSEALGVLGQYLREKGTEGTLQTLTCIVGRAGKRSRHQAAPTD